MCDRLLVVVGMFAVSHAFAGVDVPFVDLDGDEYFVCWDDRLLPPDQKYPAADFSNGACAFQVRPLVTPLGLSRHDRLRHFLNTVNCPNPPVTLGEIDSCFQYWAEEKDPASSECRRLAAIFNCAVDGKEVRIEWCFRQARGK